MATMLFNNTNEGGTDGVTVSAANSGGASGDAYTTVTLGAGNQGFFTTAWKLLGSLGLRLIQASANQLNIWINWFTAYNDLSFRVGFTIGSMPLTTFVFMRFFSDNVTTIKLNWSITNTGKSQINDAVGGVTVASSSGISANTDYVAVGRYLASTKTFSVKIYPKGSATEVPGTSATVSIPTDTSLQSVRFGISTGSAGTSATPLTLTIDDLGYATAGMISRTDIANTAPIADAGVDRTVEPWTLITLSGSASSDIDGTVTSYSWSQISGTAVSLSGSGSDRTFTAPGSIAGSTLVFGLIVTDDLGATSTQATVSITILPCLERAAIGGVLVPVQFMAVFS